METRKNPLDRYEYKKPSELNQIYNARGFFYDLILPKLTKSCRSVLEIYEKTIQEKDLPDREPDCTFIMMNPGSSEPLNSTPVPVRFPEDKAVLISPTLVPAKPDDTQYQVMRIMDLLGWKYVRVLNLSDIRQSKSGLFLQEYTDFEQICGSDVHSLFSPHRSEERGRHLQTHRPVVLAWGVSKAIKGLANRYAPRLSLSHSFGYRKEGHLYYHPLRPNTNWNKEWFCRITDQLVEGLN